MSNSKSAIDDFIRSCESAVASLKALSEPSEPRVFTEQSRKLPGRTYPEKDASPQ